ncbi:E3 ubiquitin-protein ligase [Phytophthora nicotianae]|uniref:E3 ubiquitin-protein ligase n=1 Tax=Phytophthora nicotianae TaxID=4792 RepID=A0A0W8DC05_PHYNI|nr:E3 ubiquitin-protein ligase [Phytophthora nicotianae]
MDGIGGGNTFFVSRHHEHLPATLDELLRVSSKCESISGNADTADVISLRAPDADDADSDSDFSAAMRLRRRYRQQRIRTGRVATPRGRAPRSLYLHEMRHQRGRMDEKEAQWVRGYIKAQRAWKARTGRSIDEFYIPNTSAHGMKKSLPVKENWSCTSFTQERGQEQEASLLVEITGLETVLLIAAVVFICSRLSFSCNTYL